LTIIAIGCIDLALTRTRLARCSLHDCADLAATDSVGIKHRGQTKLEIKSRGACYKEDVGGASEAYVKVKLGKGADVPAVIDYLRQTGILTKELEHRLLQPIEIHTAKLVSVLTYHLRVAFEECNDLPVKLLLLKVQFLRARS
jgi:hypothetical protein